MSRRTSAIAAPGHRLVAADEADEAVEEVAARDELDRVGDHLARDQRGAHAGRAHRDAVGDGDRVELDRRAAGGADAVLHVHGELALVQVARHRLDPGRRDADERLREILVGEADGLQHRAGAGAVDAVGERSAAALGGIGGLRVDAHAGGAPWSAIARGRTCASGRRGLEARRRRRPRRAFAAQTTTDGPEPESVTPAAPGTGSSRSSASSGASCDAVRLVQPVVERGREELGVAGRDRGAEQRGLRARGGGLAVRARVAGRRPREASVVHALARDDDDRRERQVVGDPRGARPVPLRQLRQTPPRQRGREVVGVPLERQPEREQLVARGSRPATASPATRPAAIVAADEPSPRSSGIRLTKRKLRARRPARRARTRAARGARASRGSSSAPSPSSVDGPSPSASPRARSRGRARRAAQSKPGPRFAEVAGARTTMHRRVHAAATSVEDRRRRSARTTIGRLRSARRPRRCPSARGR